MVSLAQAVPSAVALGLQLLVSAAADSRCFNLLGLGTRCDTASDVSRRHPTLLTPSASTFDVCAYILVAELVLICFLLAVGAGLVEAVPAIPAPWLDAQPLWFAANAAQAAASAFFVTGRLAGSAVAVAATAAALLRLGASLTPLDPLPSLFLSFPVWMHAGWATAATALHISVSLSNIRCAPRAPLATAFAGVFCACGVALATLCLVGTPCLPMLAVLAWALAGIAEANATPIAGVVFGPSMAGNSVVGGLVSGSSAGVGGAAASGERGCGDFGGDGIGGGGVGGGTTGGENIGGGSFAGAGGAAASWALGGSIDGDGIGGSGMGGNGAGKSGTGRGNIIGGNGGFAGRSRGDASDGGRGSFDPRRAVNGSTVNSSGAKSSGVNSSYSAVAADGRAAPAVNSTGLISSGMNSGSTSEVATSGGREALARAASACAALLLGLLVAGSILSLWRQAHTWQQYN
jgi:hypothetical protein